MHITTRASTCRWAVPTLFFAPPLWMYAWDAPWTCVRDGDSRVLGSTHGCATCPGWESPAEMVGCASNIRPEDPTVIAR